MGRGQGFWSLERSRRRCAPEVPEKAGEAGAQVSMEELSIFHRVLNKTLRVGERLPFAAKFGCRQTKFGSYEES